MNEIAIFVALQFANVVLSTIKSILTVSGGRLTAAVINAISYTFGAVITKLITSQSFEVVIATTLVTNIVGVYVAKWFIDKTRKEKLWTFLVTIRSTDHDDFENDLRKRSIQFTLVKAANDRHMATIFSQSKGESALIRETLQKYDAKYVINESRN